MSRGARVARLGLMLALVVAIALIGGCGPSKAEVAQQQKDECFANEQRIKLATDMVNADTGVYPSITDVVDKLHITCPSGGSYSFDPNTNVVTCSVHGHP